MENVRRRIEQYRNVLKDNNKAITRLKFIQQIESLPKEFKTKMKEAEKELYYREQALQQVMKELQRLTKDIK